MEVKEYINTLLLEVAWLQKVINQVIGTYLQHEGEYEDWTEIPSPDLEEVDNPYATSVKKWELNAVERLALALTLTPHINPEMLDIFFGRNKLYDRGFTEFGGIMDKEHSGFIPTGQTLLFLATATHPELRIEVINTLNASSILVKEQVITLESTASFVPEFNGILSLSQRWAHYFITGQMPAIEHNVSFPAKRITTHLEWDDVVLSDIVMEQVHELKAWLEHGNVLMDKWQLYKKIKPGYRALFYGPPGTGKTLTVSMLGKNSSRDVYRVDLSMIVSKYIGETEKNLSRIFDSAQYKDWILFFDEADALFGKRTEAKTSNDRHANQQTAYLLQRIEDFPGTIILASNLKANMDDAFTRRFQAMIHFTMPDVEERYQLWKNAFSGTCTLDPAIDLWQVAENYELAGGSIINILRYCALAAISRQDTVVTKQELVSGIKREFKKENKTIRLLS